MSHTSSATQSSLQSQANAKLTVADAVWIAAATLQREAPNAEFETQDIVDRTQELKLTEGAFKSIWQHVNQHCVANRPPQPNKACMLFAKGKGRRRLYRESTDHSWRDPGREGGRTHPDWKDLPSQYSDLRHWYETEWNRASQTPIEDPLLAVAGLARGMWDGLDADAFVDSLRVGWEGRA